MASENFVRPARSSSSMMCTIELNGASRSILISTTMSLLLESSALRSPIAERLAGGMPAFGTCAGLILLAGDILDGRPDQRSFGVIDLAGRRNGYGRQLDSFETDIDVVGLDGGPVHAVFIRAPIVESTGDAVEVLATVDDRPVLCRQGPIVVAAFHPELSDDTTVHEYFLRLAAERSPNTPSLSGRVVQNSSR